MVDYNGYCNMQKAQIYDDTLMCMFIIRVGRATIRVPYSVATFEYTYQISSPGYAAKSIGYDNSTCQDADVPSPYYGDCEDSKRPSNTKKKENEKITRRTLCSEHLWK